MFVGSKMVGGLSRKDESLVIQSTNVFAALGSLEKKKKKKDSSGKDQGSSKNKGSVPNKETDPKEILWAPAPLNVKSWADVDDEDDDDFYAAPAPPDNDSKTVEESEAITEEGESDEEGMDGIDEDDEDQLENEPEAPVKTEPVVKKPAEGPSAPRETERQLSKKELKKKGLEELEAVLAELGCAQGETSAQDNTNGGEKEPQNINVEMGKKENASGESKSAKKKKKEKSSKEQKELEAPADNVEVENTVEGTATTDKVEEASFGDVKERLKKVASLKKKKSSKEMDAAARAAAIEAAARNAKLAAAKKKDKNHYNQQSLR